MADPSRDPVEKLVARRHDDTFGFDWELWLRRVDHLAAPRHVPVVRVPGQGGVGHGVYDLDEPIDTTHPAGSGVGEITPGLLATFHALPQGTVSKADVRCADGSVIPGHIVGIPDTAVDFYVCFADRPAAAVLLTVDGGVVEHPISTAGFDI